MRTDLVATALDRLRAIGLRLRGAKLGARCRVGAAGRFVRPAGLQTGERVQLEHGVFIKITRPAARVSIGSRSFIGFGTELDVSQSLVIGDDVLIAPGCFITDQQHRHARGIPIADQGIESSPVVIESGAWLGAKVVVLPGVRIGSGAIVGAGAVVTRDVAANSIVAGVPARPIGARP